MLRGVVVVVLGVKMREIMRQGENRKTIGGRLGVTWDGGRLCGKFRQEM